MDTPTTIIGLLIVLICILPFILIIKKNATKRKMKLQLLTDSAAKTNGVINKNEFWSQSGIGIDFNNKVLYFSNETLVPDSYVSINLKGIQSFEIAKTEDNLKTITKLALQLNYFDKGKQSIDLNFYEKEKNILLVNELEITNRWHKILGQLI